MICSGLGPRTYGGSVAEKRSAPKLRGRPPRGGSRARRRGLATGLPAECTEQGAPRQILASSAAARRATGSCSTSRSGMQMIIQRQAFDLSGCISFCSGCSTRFKTRRQRRPWLPQTAEWGSTCVTKKSPGNRSTCNCRSGEKGLLRISNVRKVHIHAGGVIVSQEVWLPLSGTSASADIHQATSRIRGHRRSLKWTDGRDHLDAARAIRDYSREKVDGSHHLLEKNLIFFSRRFTVNCYLVSDFPRLCNPP